MARRHLRPLDSPSHQTRTQPHWVNPAPDSSPPPSPPPPPPQPPLRRPPQPLLLAQPQASLPLPQPPRQQIPGLNFQPPPPSAPRPLPQQILRRIPVTELTQLPHLLTIRFDCNSFIGSLNSGESYSNSISEFNVSETNYRGKSQIGSPNFRRRRSLETGTSAVD